LPWLRWVVLAVGLAAAIALLAGRLAKRTFIPAAGAAVATALVAPLAYALNTVAAEHPGSVPTAGPAVASTRGPGGAGFPGGPSGGFPGGGQARQPIGGFPGRWPGWWRRRAVGGVTVHDLTAAA
jgi:hypothetical protein